MAGRKRGQQTRELSPRQLAVLRCIADGMQGEEICRALGIKEGTLRTHRAWLFLKLEAHSAVEAAMAGVRLGLIDPTKSAQVEHAEAEKANGSFSSSTVMRPPSCSSVASEIRSE